MQINKRVFYVCMAAVALIFFFMVVNIISKEIGLRKANKELSVLRAENDKLVKENKEKIAEYKTAMFIMDSIFKQSTITHEKEIHNHWNTVYNNLVVSDTSYRFISDYLYKLGQQ